MYSVLIQNKKTMESFHEFYPLFLSVMDEKVGTCRWLENGTTIDKALPELGGMINDKEEWRAIIVRVEDEDAMSAFESCPENPYDFLHNKNNKNDSIVESPIPLIRLTHMLGGVPQPEIMFEKQKVDIGFGVEKVVFLPKKSIEREYEHTLLSQKYAFDGKLPSQIIIISMNHIKKHTREKVKDLSRDLFETDSSEFWKRNNYPGMCRFIAYDYDNEGPVQKEADLFNFWMSTMLVAANIIDANILKAYRLYTIKTKFDKKLMQETMQRKSVYLAGVQNFINEEIKKDIDKKMEGQDKLPKYKLNIPVYIDVPTESQVTINHKVFPLCSKTESDDSFLYKTERNKAEGSLFGAFKGVERKLDECSDYMRHMGRFREHEVYALDRFKVEDLNEELDEINHNILRIQSKLPDSQFKRDVKLAELLDEVKESLETRTEGVAVRDFVFVTVACLILGFIPNIIYKFGMGLGGILGGAINSVIIFAAMLVAGLIVLAIDKFWFTRKIKKYNERMLMHLENFSNNESLYKEYVNNIVAYSRGKSYLEIFRQKRFEIDDQYGTLHSHYRAASFMLDKIKKWCTAYYLKINVPKDYDQKVMIDANVAPQYNSMYTFEVNREYQVPVNETGDYVIAPFCFIEKLEIRREELYEDDRSNT